MEHFEDVRKRKGSWLFQRTVEQTKRFGVVEKYAARLICKAAANLRASIDVCVQLQLPAQLFEPGLDPGVRYSTRLPTPEEKASYNWIRRLIAAPDSPWKEDSLERLNHKLHRALVDNRD